MIGTWIVVLGYLASVQNCLFVAAIPVETGIQ